MKIVTFIFIFFSARATGQNKYVNEIEKYMKAEVVNNRFNGNILIAKGGKIIYTNSYGWTNYKTRQRLDSNSIFDLASVSKQFTALGILLLLQKNRIHLSDPIKKYFPKLPYQNITIHELLNHTSGLPEYEEMGKKWNHYKVAHNKDVINWLIQEEMPLHFEPGSKFEYSNTGYVLLASLIEKISRISYNNYLKKYIFLPLNMKHTRVIQTEKERRSIPDFAYSYIYSDSLKKYVRPESLQEYDYVGFLSGIYGDGAIHSTTGDLFKWEQALKDRVLFSDTIVNLMLSPQSLMDTINRISYGYGVALGNSHYGKFVAHSGSWPGYSTNLTNYIDSNLVVIVLSNNESNAPEISKSLATIMFGKNVMIPSSNSKIKDFHLLDLPYNKSLQMNLNSFVAYNQNNSSWLFILFYDLNII